MTSQSHRSTTSFSQNNLQPPIAGPTPKQQRRSTSPASTTSLSAPDVPRPQGRPPSPLRNAFIPDTFTGIDPDESYSDDEEDEFGNARKWAEGSPSPSSSVSNLAASFTQRVNNFLGSMAPRSSGSMPSDAEIEADAERERERSRREAERILTREAAERKLVEERVLEMMNNARSLPPPPSRSESNPPSPSGSQKEKESWWTSAKNKLTPTKEPPTPAQQVILDSKARDKDNKKKAKEKGKEKDRNDPPTNESMQNLSLPPPPHRKPVPQSPSSPTPSRPSLSNMAPNLSPSPMRSIDGVSSSPSREAPLLYAQFNAQGTLDVAGTLLTIAKRFEKLEKWTVGHVRALEDRMSDVERWLVDKEKEREKGDAPTSSSSSSPSEVAQEIREVKDGLTELQGRVGALGREMAKFATSPTNLSSGPSRQPAPVSTAPRTASTHVIHDIPASPSSPSFPLVTSTVAAMTTPPHSRFGSSTARDSTSPPMVSSSKTSGTRLPYPTGDYASPPDSSALLQGPFASPPHSPTSSLGSSARIRPLTIPGLGQGLGILQTASNSSLRSSNDRAPSPSQQHGITSPVTTHPSTPTTTTTNMNMNNTTASPVAQPQTPQAQAQAHGLPPPKRPTPRTSSVSPTPRKRYTVALGEPIVPPPDLQRRPSPRPDMNMTSSPVEDASEEDDDEFQDETIGKSSSARFVKPRPTNGDYKTTPVSAPGIVSSSVSSSASATATSPSPATKRRLRAQSAYGFVGVQQLQASQSQQFYNTTTGGGGVAPLRTKMRSRSTERLGGGGGGQQQVPGPEQSFPTGKFVDPLVLRRQERENLVKDGSKPAVRKPGEKLPVGKLVAYFDQDKRGRK